MAPILLVVLILFSVSSGSRFQPRIHDGIAAVPHEFPWMAMITNLEGIQVCGGSVINKHFVLTAAHCVLALPSINPPNLVVRLGAHNKTNPFEPTARSFRIRQIIRHPEYLPMFQNDFALLELEKAAEFNDAVSSICLAKPQLKIDNERAIIAGWGRLSPTGPSSQALRKGFVRIMTMETCRLIYHSTDNPKTRISDSMFCARNSFPEKMTDACGNDSGGPIMVIDKESKELTLVGVISWGVACGSFVYPGVYARVSFARNWIVDKIGNTTIC